MRPSNAKSILDACQLSFEGKTDEEIKERLDVSKTSLTRWRKTELWQEFEAELIDAHKQAVLSTYRESPVPLTSTQ